MQADSTLIGIAQVAVAVAGFSGIAAAIGSDQRGGGWSSGARIRFVDLLAHSGIALFASLAPLVFAYQSGLTPLLWSISSSLWAGFALAGVVFGQVRMRRRRSLEGRRLAMASLWAALFFTLLAGFQVYNAIVIRAFWPYLLALVGNLAFAFWQFIALVVPRAEPREP